MLLHAQPHMTEAYGIGVIFIGMLAAILHVISGPDHLAAVTPLAVEQKKRPWKIGLLWGFGHLLGMLLLGLAFLWARSYIPVEWISAQSEKIVGIILVLVGLWSIIRAYKKRKKHIHPHIHMDPAPFTHVHEHQHDHIESHQHESSHIHTHSSKSFMGMSSLLIGVIHGFAGISHMIYILPSLAFEKTSQSVTYLSGFGVGSILAMTAYAGLLGILAKRIKSFKKESIYFGMQVASGVFALLIGFIWIFFMSSH